MTEPGDGFQRAVCEPDHDGCHARDVHQVWQQDSECDASGTAGVDGVAAGLQDREPGGRGEIVPGGNAVPGAVQRGARAGHGWAFVVGVAGGVAAVATIC